MASVTALQRQTITNNSGTQHVPSLAVGAHMITVSKDGIRAVGFRNVDLSVGQSRTIDT